MTRRGTPRGWIQDPPTEPETGQFLGPISGQPLSDRDWDTSSTRSDASRTPRRDGQDVQAADLARPAGTGWTARRSGRAVAEGVVQGRDQRTDDVGYGQARRMVQVLSFRVHDFRPGGLNGSVQVEMRGRSISGAGAVRDNDHVRVFGRWQHGKIVARSVVNLQNGAWVRVSRRGPFGTRGPGRFATVVLVAGLLVLVLFGVAAGVSSYRDFQRPVTVPAVAGASEAIARDTFSRAGFTRVETVQDDKARVAFGRVDRTRPPAGQRVPRSTVITLYVSVRQMPAASGKVTVLPDIVGVADTVALDRLESAGFVNVKVVHDPDARAAFGRVDRTEPRAGARVDTGRQIKVFVSVRAGSGQAQGGRSGGGDGGSGDPAPTVATVPRLAGADSSGALGKLTDAGFVNVNVIQDPRAKAAFGVVDRTDPPGGTRQDTSRQVTVYVSVNPHESPTGQDTDSTALVPTVRGTSAVVATDRLNRAGFADVTVVQDPNGTAPFGTVDRTDPPAGRRVTSTQQVTVYVSVRAPTPSPTPVPDASEPTGDQP